jgi:hypothetical protein
VLQGEVVILQVGTLAIGLDQNPVQSIGGPNLGIAINPGKTVEKILERSPQVEGSDTKSIKQRIDDPLVLPEKSEPQMGRLDSAVVGLTSDLGSFEKGSPASGGEFFWIHFSVPIYKI